ncbi:MAG: helix-turn-helix transcriptional regulator [Treponema sp.]|nr:helix-turn-helix transcriptional regulator [Treponema sp.]
MKIIENLDRILKEKNITAYKLEKEKIVKQQTITNWRKGSEPSAEKIKEIINYIGVSPNEIFGYNEPEADQEQEKLTENEKELLKYFRQLPDREQIKMIGRIEDKVNQRKD